MEIKRIEKGSIEIPTASTGDIAFLLIVFFMVTTVFRAEQGLRINLPAAENAKKLPNKGVAHIWIGEDGIISIDDNIVPVSYVGILQARKAAENPGLITSVEADKNVNYGVVNDVFDELSANKVLRISLATKKRRI
ncbi:biopolymer transporter ExbD [candidate division TA06 bacterium]|uniref:Biopolymer transporter ExbD n=1 Tax=candidate division TA06 bacterium TaxID=2250710 RepID=A0A660S820_UNCT6|nr:MAG: biopolymer transporter ExbD [candidate division TA06 bacterium]